MTRMTADIHTAPSRIHGAGIIAGRAFRAGERIAKRNIARDVTPDAPLRPDDGEYEHHCDWLADGRQVLLGVPDRYLNHACEPNSYIREIDGVQYIYAYRDIATGDELTNDYCMYSEGDVVWQCNCGALACRRTIHADYFHLPLLKQAEYMPLQPDWFLAERRAEFDMLRGRLRDLGITPAAAPHDRTGSKDQPQSQGAARRIIDDPRELTEDTARRLVDALDRTGAMAPIRRLRGNQVASAILGAIGLALFLVGVENAATDIPLLSNSYGSMAVGLLLLAITGALLTRLRGH
jgi:hypothetical protein